MEAPQQRLEDGKGLGRDRAVSLALGRPTRQGARLVHDAHLGVAVEGARAAVAENLLAAWS